MNRQQELSQVEQVHQIDWLSILACACKTANLRKNEINQSKPERCNQCLTLRSTGLFENRATVKSDDVDTYTHVLLT